MRRGRWDFQSRGRRTYDERHLIRHSVSQIGKRRMSSRAFYTILAAIFLLLPARTNRADEPSHPASGASAAISPASAPATRPSRDENPPGIVDKLVQVGNADAWSEGTLTNANVQPNDPPRIELGFRESDFPRMGSWTGPQVETDFPFTELIASFNPTTPADCGITLDMRVEQDGIWSPWLYLQSWGKTLTPVDRVTRWDAGHVSIDTLMLDKPATSYQCRLGLISFETDPKSPRPSVRRLSVCYSGVVSDPQRRAKLLKGSNDPTTHPASTGEWARDLQVPFRGQGDSKNPKSIRKLICSPTSTSMVLQYYGIDRTTMENATAIYDPQYDMFGNWGRAVARAGDLGLDAYLTRFRNWDQVHQMIARGVPVIASIRFRKGEVKGFLYEFTKGHLLVIRGFKPNGDVIVDDPARKDQGNGVVYGADEMAKAWFNHGGVGYVIEKPPGHDSALADGTAAAK